MSSLKSGAAVGGWLLCAAAAAGLVTAAVDTFSPGNGIAFTLGTYLVLVSTAILLVMALLLVSIAGRGRRVLLHVLVAIDLAGTATAAYFLTAHLLIVFMAIALAGWLIHLFVDPAPRPSRV